jgi:hypothetical protein
LSTGDQAGSTVNSAPAASAELTEIRYAATVSVAPGATVTGCPSAENVTPDGSIDSIAINGPRAHENDVRPLVVIVRPPAPRLTIEPLVDTLISQVPAAGRPDERDGDGAVVALAPSPDAGEASPVTLEEHPAVSSATDAAATSNRAAAVRDCVKIFTPGMVPLPPRRCHTGPDPRGGTPVSR